MRTVGLLACWCLLVHGQPEQEDLYMPECRKALGMQSEEIPDSAISASSTYHEENVGPRSARIRTDLFGGAWCPDTVIESGVYEWLQIDFAEFKVITKVETQGRFGNGQGQEYAPSYLLEYQRIDGGRWLRYRDYKNQEIIPGNTNTYMQEVRDLAPPIIARSLRFVPHSNHKRMVCMRVEAYGCSAEDIPIAYTMRQGDSRGEINLFDFFYDGENNNNILSGGMGQLTDFKEGQSNFRLDTQEVGKKGYEWIGWKNDTLLPSPPVQIIFSFSSVRNFSAVRLHCNNMFTKDVRVFRVAEVYFSVKEGHFASEPVVFEFLKDSLIELSRYVIIPIPHRIGKFVKVVLRFEARWILLSEVKFDSVRANATNVKMDEPSLSGSHPPSIAPAVITYPSSIEPNIQRFAPGGTANSGYDTDDSTKNDDPAHIEVNIVPANPETSVTPPAAEHRRTRMDDASIGIIIGTLAALILLLMAGFTITLLRRRKQKLATSTMKAMFASDHIHFNMNDLSPTLSNGKISAHGNTYNAIATGEEGDKDGSVMKVRPEEMSREVSDGIQCRLLPDPPISNGTCSSQEYASADVLKYAGLVVSLPPQPIYDAACHPGPTPAPAVMGGPRDSPPPPPPPPHPRAICAASADVVSIQGLTGNSMYVVGTADVAAINDDLPLREFPRDKLKFVEKLGEGQFGEVHLCEALSIPELTSDSLHGNRAVSRSMLVAVKMLRPNASEHARADFHKEVTLMSRLKNPNIVCVLGVCCQEEPLAVVVEYMKQGDLNQFLLRHCHEGSIPRAGQTIISYGGLIYMGMQIAAGMKYLETLNMVHRDLATRNCLVGYNYTIKISDFGMSRSLYSNDYYRIEGKAVLPIRWMAWESVLLGKFSCKSDVWSMAVTLWEVLTLARNQPYDLLSDDEVIENCGHYYRNDGNEICLPQPNNCPKEIFDLMRECWNRDEAQRPSFREIHMFLLRKNMGYDPLEVTTTGSSRNSVRSSVPHV